MVAGTDHEWKRRDHHGSGLNMQGIVLRANGEYKEKDFPDLASMQNAVGGYIEVLTVGPWHDPVDHGEHILTLIVNEEGRFQGLEQNWYGDEIIANLTGFLGAGLVGDIILFGETDGKGSWKDAPPGLIQMVDSICEDDED